MKKAVSKHIPEAENTGQTPPRAKAKTSLKNTAQAGKKSSPKKSTAIIAKTTKEEPDPFLKKKSPKSASPKRKVKTAAELPEIVHIVLQLNYHTQEGQSIWVTSTAELLGDSVLKEMQYEDNDHWKIQLLVPTAGISKNLTYRYHIRNTDGTFQEDAHTKAIPLSWLQYPHLFVRDFWDYAGYAGNVFYKRPFEYLLAGEHKNNHKKGKKTSGKPVPTHLFEVQVPYLPDNTSVCLIGAAPELGEWKKDQFLPLVYNQDKSVWETAVSILHTDIPIAYKYAFYDIRTHAITRFEEGENRLSFSWLAPSLVVQNDGFIRFSQTEWKGAGINIPLSSIRTSHDYGIGDLGSVRTLVDWMAATGFKLLQLLPINDTSMTGTWMDSYPYAALSAFALHPIYVDIEALLTAELRTNPGVVALLEKGKALNALPQVDYEAAYHIKGQLLRIAYQALGKKHKTLAGYKAFIRENESWLKPYAAFCVLRDQYGTPDFSTWTGEERFTEDIFEELWRKNKTGLQFYYFVQYVLHHQLISVKEYAHAQQVVLKGDIAIGVGRYSADVWERPDLFHIEMQAGAPPDFFVKTGQNWGFPTYNWENMERDGYTWWKERLRQTAQYFDAIRLDHILGFFRIWSIPYAQVQGILGYFQPVVPVSQAEFAAWNIPFNYDRYCRPYINDRILTETFGERAEDVKIHYLLPNPDGTYRFKDEFDNQRKIQEKCGKDRKEDQILLPALLDLMANVILIPDPLPGKYHCRFALYETSSYQYLSDWEKKQLYYLYVDYYYTRQERGWMQSGQKKLETIASNTDMMVCGEDLGMVPPVVPVVMERLGYLGLRVQRMSSDSHNMFTNPESVPYLEVVMPSTHDVPPIRNWWNNLDATVKNEFWHTQLYHNGDAPQRFNPSLAEEIILAHLQSPAIWSIFLLQDLLSLDENTWNPQPENDMINRPEITPFYWRYRMHISMEQLNEIPSINEKIKKLLQLSSR